MTQDEQNRCEWIKRNAMVAVEHLDGCGATEKLNLKRKVSEIQCAPNTTNVQPVVVQTRSNRFDADQPPRPQQAQSQPGRFVAAQPPITHPINRSFTFALYGKEKNGLVMNTTKLVARVLRF